MNWAEEEADAGTYATCAYTYVTGPRDANGNKVRRMVFSGEGIVGVLRHVFPRKSYEGGKTRFKFTRMVDYTFLAQRGGGVVSRKKFRSLNRGEGIISKSLHLDSRHITQKPFFFLTPPSPFLLSLASEV